MIKIKVKDLLAMEQEEVMAFIRNRLAFTDDISSQLRNVDTNLFAKEHRRFDMSGYGNSVVQNMDIINIFAYLGIYRYVSYLFLECYKGTPTLHFKHYEQSDSHAFDLSGLGTTEIIYKIFLHTIFTNKPQRREF